MIHPPRRPQRSQFPPALSRALFVLIFLLAAILRFTNLNWDEGEWIHPDEGHMRAITWYIHTPDPGTSYFDTANSTLNSINRGHMYSYGTLPLFLVRYTVEWLEWGCSTPSNRLALTVGKLLLPGLEIPCAPTTFTFDHSAVVGRFYSASAELGVTLLVFLIARRLYGETVGLLAMALQGFTAFAIQQAHFFTVDSLAGFFIVLAGYFSIRAAARPPGRSPAWIEFGLAGVATGLATACKISAGVAALFVLLAGLSWGSQALTNFQQPRSIGRVLRRVAAPVFLFGLLAGLLALVMFRLAQPYAFQGPGLLGLHPSPDWLGRLAEILWEQNGDIDLPPGIQWTARAPILFPWVNMVFWGFGLPLGLAAWGGWAFMGSELLRGRREHAVLWGWTTVIFLYLASRWTMTMRYFLPLYPLLAVMAAYGLVRLCRARISTRVRRVGVVLAVLVLAGAALWSWAIFSAYLKPHTRVAASRWIYANVPAGATVANEHWDWGLPLTLGGRKPFENGAYIEIKLALFDEDTPEKRDTLIAQLDQTDWLFLASNRIYGSIPQLAARYPLAVEYYRALFAGELGFELAADFTAHPAIGPLQFPDQENPFPLLAAEYASQPKGLSISFPPAEESFSVYDHPRVLIFRKTPAYSRERVLQILGSVDLDNVPAGLTPAAATPRAFLVIRDLRLWGVLTLVASMAFAVRIARKPSALGPPQQEHID